MNKIELILKLIIISVVYVIVFVVIVRYIENVIKKEKCLNTPFSEMKEIDYCKEYWNNGE